MHTSLGIALPKNKNKQFQIKTIFKNDLIAEILIKKKNIYIY